MWESVITTLEEQDAVGDALPIRCEQYPEELSFVKEPGVVSQISPQGQFFEFTPPSSSRTLTDVPHPPNRRLPQAMRRRDALPPQVPSSLPPDRQEGELIALLVILVVGELR